MRRRRLPVGIIVPAALVLLVGLLAGLQYRWLGQVSEAERDEMRTGLERRVTEFADDFDREFSRAYAVFRGAGDGFDPLAPDALVQPLDQWRATSRYPALVKHIYYAHEDKGEIALERYDPNQRSFARVSWPENLASVRSRLSPEIATILPPSPMAGATSRVVAFSTTMIVSDVPALTIPLMLPGGPQPLAASRSRESTAPGELTDMLFTMRLRHAYLVLEFDRQVITDEMLPALADTHFGSDRYRVAVVDAQQTPLLTRGLERGNSIEPAQADVTAPLMVLRTDLREWTTTTRGAGAFGVTLPGGTAGRMGAGGRGTVQSKNSVSIFVEQRSSGAAQTLPLRTLSTGWQVRLQHAAGSLDAAVAHVRRRNLWLSFGILSVLVASVGLIVLNARRSERLADQQMDFVATVSHELRTPLAVIRSAAQNLAAGVVHDKEQTRQYGDLIENEGRRLTDMVEQVLEYAGISANRRLAAPRPVDLGAIVRDVVASSASLVDAGQVHVVVEIESRLPMVLGDEDAIRRAVSNLVTNALKYGVEGRWLGVAVERVEGRGRPEARVSVTDKGRGIDPSDLPQIFEAFYRGRHAVERQIHGNGLGLSLVKRIAEAHGGRVAVKSTPGQGSTFMLYLPASAAEVVAEPADSDSLGDPSPTSGPLT